MAKQLQFACVAAAAILLTVSPSGQAGAPDILNRLSAHEQPAEWAPLFDGTTLSGWRGYKRSDAAGTRWKVESGLLTVDPAGAAHAREAIDLITTATFDHFELAFEWRIAPGANSGVKYFVLEDGDAAIGHEYQIIDDERHPDARVAPNRRTASLYDVLAASPRPSSPSGEFNQSSILVQGTSVEHWLNGARVLQYQLDSPALRAAIARSKFKDVARFGKLKRGHILLQDHGDRVWYRHIRIRTGERADEPGRAQDEPREPRESIHRPLT